MKYDERKWLEALEVMSNFFYGKTGDKWYLKLNKQATKKLGKKEKE